MLAEIGLVEAWITTAGGIVGGVAALTLISKVPGGKQAFNLLVRDPLAKWLDNRFESSIETIVKGEVADQIKDALAPLESKIDSVNYAVNNVEPGVPPIKDKVRHMQTMQIAMDEKLDTVLEIVKTLVAKS